MTQSSPYTHPNTGAPPKRLLLQTAESWNTVMGFKDAA